MTALADFARGGRKRLQRPIHAAHQKQRTSQRHNAAKHAPSEPCDRKILLDDPALRKHHTVKRRSHLDFGDEYGWRRRAPLLRGQRALRTLKNEDVGFRPELFAQPLAHRADRGRIRCRLERFIADALRRDDANAALFTQLDQKFAVLRGGNAVERGAYCFQVADVA